MGPVSIWQAEESPSPQLSPSRERGSSRHKQQGRDSRIGEHGSDGIRTTVTGDAEMSTRIGINGFGRMGKQTLRAALERYPDKLEVVAVNSRRGRPEDIAHLFKYDSTYGRYPGDVAAS